VEVLITQGILTSYDCSSFATLELFLHDVPVDYQESKKSYGRYPLQAVVEKL